VESRPAIVQAKRLKGSRPYLKPWLNYIVIGFILIVTIPLIIWIFKELRKMQKENKEKGKE
jgi:hypothetical protein